MSDDFVILKVKYKDWERLREMGTLLFLHDWTFNTDTQDYEIAVRAAGRRDT
jgi:hypothetical protein